MLALWIFPGQGGQRANMLVNVDPLLRQQVEDELLLTLADTDDAYLDSVQLQVAIELLQVDQINVLRSAGFNAKVAAGHSLGVFAAAYALGSIMTSDLFKTVKLRAELMQGSYPNGYGMGVVVGLSRSEVEELVQEVTTVQAPVYSSNQNAVDQVAISGQISAIDQVISKAKRAGAGKALRLRVPVPSHSPLMADVATQLASYLNHVEVKPPTGIYLANDTGHAVRQSELVKKDLGDNLAHPVFFDTMMDVANDYRPEVVVGFGPGRPFKGIIAQKFAGIHQLNLDQVSIADAIYLLNKWERGF